jgi:hypothetical protein
METTTTIVMARTQAITRIGRAPIPPITTEGSAGARRQEASLAIIRELQPFRLRCPGSILSEQVL